MDIVNQKFFENFLRNLCIKWFNRADFDARLGDETSAFYELGYAEALYDIYESFGNPLDEFDAKLNSLAKDVRSTLNYE